MNSLALDGNQSKRMKTVEMATGNHCIIFPNKAWQSADNKEKGSMKKPDHTPP